MKYKVSSTVLQELINYLANKPYLEVVNLIQSLQKDAVVINEESEKAGSMPNEN